MKKTFLSLAFVLSISLAFGNETKPVSFSKKSKEVSFTNQGKETKKKATNVNVVKKVEVVECFVLSCGTACGTFEEQLGPDETMLYYSFYDTVFCNNDCECYP
ncbi:hypothetical protein GCM10011514_43530 [Emticicia aquatilis]|uniref:Uncharacterized protein n=1 Tax=Emticicia aquatilis TaxID=1537369 RepID=A0A916Z3W3_9BACT|nr:hypothetical protein [Emticicia aquatilis]GGD74783.1 hypothetical protein GCM10011514_43530 [Emticicia aquatilis]